MYGLYGKTGTAKLPGPSKKKPFEGLVITIWRGIGYNVEIVFE
jgi:hypothetical protein